MSILVLSAAEQRVYRALLKLADQLDLPLTHRQVAAMARIATRAANKPRPKDTESAGRKPARKAAVRPPAGRKPRSAGSESPEPVPVALAGIEGVGGAA